MRWQWGERVLAMCSCYIVGPYVLQLVQGHQSSCVGGVVDLSFGTTASFLKFLREPKRYFFEDLGSSKTSSWPNLESRIVLTLSGLACGTKHVGS